uniref:Uncharacterized protein LOC101498803 n=1 Tax=Cicer arietinum TaxID=3827 RepID=A0A1S2XLA1_CICAR|nr:uncharacterized protein LOC101498803 [Cicer arietinum]
MVTAITKARNLTNMKLEDLVGALRAHEPLLLADKPSRKGKMVALKTSQIESPSSKKTEDVMKKESLYDESYSEQEKEEEVNHYLMAKSETEKDHVRCRFFKKGGLPQDNTIHVVNSDDSETTASAEPTPQPIPSKTSSKSSTPKKAKLPSKKLPSPASKISATTKLFESSILETQYVSKWQNKHVVNGKIIDLANLKQGGFDVEDMFDQLGWTSFLHVNEPQYPRLVRAFYAASNSSKGNNDFSVVLKGVHMEINPTTLCQILDIRDEGAYLFSENWYSQCQVTRTDILKNTHISPPKSQVASNLLPICRILHNICTPLHLGNLIFCFMSNVVVLGRSAPYGMILTTIFKFFNLPLHDEPSIQFNNTFSMKNVKQMRLNSVVSTPIKSSSTVSHASKKKKAHHSPFVTLISEPESTHPPTEDAPQQLLQESILETAQPPTEHVPTSSPVCDSPIPTFVPVSPPFAPIHTLYPHCVDDPPQEDTTEASYLNQMEDGEELYFDLNVSYHHFSPPSPLKDMLVETSQYLNETLDTTLPPPTSTAIVEEPSQPLPEVPSQFGSIGSFFSTTINNTSKDKAGSSQNKSSSVNDKPKESNSSKRTEERKNNRHIKLLKTIRKDQKKVLQSFNTFQYTIAHFGLILEWVTKHLIPTVAPGDHPPELPTQPSSDVPDPSLSSSFDEPSSSK